MKIKEPEGCSDEAKMIIITPCDSGYASFLISQTDDSLYEALNYCEKNNICKQKVKFIRKEMDKRDEARSDSKNESNINHYPISFQRKFTREWNEMRKAAGKLKTENGFRKHIMDRFCKVD